jgi:hypothetical protein
MLYVESMPNRQHASSTHPLTWLGRALALLALGFILNSLPAVIKAQTLQEDESVIVSATVPTNIAPSTPILISPPNNSYVTTNLVTFVWEGSTDRYGIQEYELYLDGNRYFDGIPTSATDNSQYTLTYNSSEHEYTLVVKVPISEGTHTWKIRAEDTQGAFADSATWTFTLDSQAPSFVITAIGDQTVSISAQDLSTVPVTPIELDNNEPLLQGTGEANSTVQLTVTIPGDPTQNFTFTVDTNGSWSQQLGILPRDTIITLDFVITDSAGNISILSGVRFLIRQEVIIFPPPSASPSPTPIPSASPGPGEPSPSPTTEPSPQASPLPPLIAIPITPPREIVYNIIQETYELLPEPLKALVATVPPETLEAIKNLGPISTALVVAAIPVLTTAAVATQFGARFSIELLARILQALGLIPSGKPRGFVFDSRTHKGIPFALLTITSITDNQNQPFDINTVDLHSLPLMETVVSDVDGVYKGVDLPPGKYQIDVRHQEFRFPTARTRPPYLTLRDYYKGEVFEILSEKDAELLFLIPMDAIEESGKRTWQNRVRVFLAYLSRFSALLILPLFVLSGILTLLFPSVWNWLVFGIYVVMVCYKSVGWFKIPRLTGVVIDSGGHPLESAIVRVMNSETSELVLVTTTNADGRFNAFIDPGNYQLSVIKPGFVWTDTPVGSLMEVNLGKDAQHLIATMEQMDQWVG